ncbi:MAG TPA: polyribonucleotide nucleotidyltransferase [Kofleriaceae bacterium]|nr:polyribonucleotide nucleotidyltransferase [Kofleriaceae bacterium]
MNHVRESVVVGGKEITIETGKLAKQAGGAVLVRIGNTIVMVTACGSKGPREGMNFLPLTCEYQEKFYAAGKIPGSFFRREGRPSEAEVLVCRLMDRPIRPLFPEGCRIDTQVIANVIGFDSQNSPDVLAMIGASASLHVSDLVWRGPLAAIRVGRIDGQFVAYPTYEEREKSDLDMIVAASRDAIVMVEGGMTDLAEATVIDALLFAHESIQPVLDLQEKLRAAAGKPKREFVAAQIDADIYGQVRELAATRIADALAVREKHARYTALDAVADDVKAALIAEGKPFEGRGGEVSEALSKVKKTVARQQTIKTRERIDGRKLDEIRAIACEVGVLPTVHGSALFTRGETQALASVTLGTKYDEKRNDTLLGDQRQTFYLHYNFPPFCTGEAKMMRSTSRREIGHGFLAQRSVEAIMPTHEVFPYTTRIVSEVLESNGSSSMASVCAGSLALMDGGVPTRAPVAGIAMGLMKEGEDYAVLSDILGDEDHLGDMDFKVTGTREGICALQMDIKLAGLDRSILEQALEQARRGRLHILDKMDEALAAPREELSEYAPRIVSVQVKPDKIRDIIGPGGKTIRAIQEQTGAKIDIDDTGLVSIASSDGKSLQQAIALIKGLTIEPEMGQAYNGVVKRIVDFGAFIEIMPGTDGLLHISEISDQRTNKVSDVFEEGDEVVVKVINIDRDGKIRLSKKQAANIPPDEINNFVG